MNFTTRQLKLYRRQQYLISKITGTILIFMFCILMTNIFYILFFESMFIVYVYSESVVLIIVIALIFIYLGFNIMFNYFMAIMQSPGYTSDLIHTLT